VEGGGLNFYGCSSLGKTTLLQIAASVWGRGGSPGFVRVWRATVNGLEGAAANTSDTLLVLDELGVAESRDLASGIYGLANGTGKARAARDGSLRQSKEWRLIFLSSGEMPIETKLREDKGRQPRAGQFVRFIDVPADRGLGFGAFDAAGPDGESSKLSARFKTGALTAYGTAGPAFVEALLANDVQGSEVRSQIDQFVSDNCPTGADGQVLRVAQRFGLIACAGEIATIFGITPWQSGDASRACAWALRQWIDNRGGGEPAEVRQAIEQVRIFIEAHGDSRFEDLDMAEELEGRRPVLNRAGWRVGKGTERLWLVPSETWKDICNGQNARFVASVLSDRGMLLRGPDGHSQVRKIAGVSTRVYVITAAIFDGGGTDDA
jgi:uncharacterized protein (DUF927 family)